MKPQRVSIAIAGHTNTGKTCFIRTLMRAAVGEVSDKPNVTQDRQTYYYEGLQATFIDTPGFENVLAAQMYLKNPNDEDMKQYEADIKYDLKAMQAIEDSNVVLYVGNLSVVPDNSYKVEVSVVKKIQPKVVAILNQKRKELQTRGEEGVNDRIAQWKVMFKEQGIESVVVFDAHWDKPGKVNEIYDSVYKTLAPEYRDLFQEGLNKFKTRQVEIRREACTILASCIRRCQKQAILIKKGQYQEIEARKKIAEELDDANLIFLTRVTRLYKMAAEYPTEFKDKLQLRMKESVDFGARVRGGAFGASVGAGGGAVIGGAIGGVIGALLGGVTAVAAAQLGAQIGGGIGSVLGGISIALEDYDDNVEVRLESEQIRNIVAANLAAVWGLSNLGFGRGRELAQDEIVDIQNEILNSQSLSSQIDWMSINESEIVSRGEAILHALEEGV